MSESPEPEAVAPEPSRRSLVRGIALLGLAGAAGVPLSGCGGGGEDVVSADGPPPAPAQLPSKSQVYRRTPEPRTRTATTPAPKAAGTQTTTRTTTAPEAQVAPEAAPVPQPVAPAPEPVTSKSAGSQTTARKPKPAADAKARTKPATKPAAPAPAPAKPSDDLSQAKTSDIPVGGGRIYPKENVVVTQPKAGEFKGFSATCTHSGCVVSEVKAGDGIVCFCHGSKFGIADGAVLRGPALLPLPAEQISVDGDRIVPGGHWPSPATAPGSRRLRRAR
jgi:Rieske Fe-S protein